MNKLRVCPKCGYIDPMEWRPRSWHTHSEIEICRFSDLQNLNLKLAEQVSKQETVLDKYYAYKLSRTGVWVYRRPRIVFDIQGWKDIPAETPKRPQRREGKKR